MGSMFPTVYSSFASCSMCSNDNVSFTTFVFVICFLVIFISLEFKDILEKITSIEQNSCTLTEYLETDKLNHESFKVIHERLDTMFEKLNKVEQELANMPEIEVISLPSKKKRIAEKKIAEKEQEEEESEPEE